MIRGNGRVEYEILVTNDRSNANAVLQEEGRVETNLQVTSETSAWAT